MISCMCSWLLALASSLSQAGQTQRCTSTFWTNFIGLDARAFVRQPLDQHLLSVASSDTNQWNTCLNCILCRNAGEMLTQSQPDSWTWLWTACRSSLQLRSSSFLLALLAAGPILSLTDQSVIIWLKYAQLCFNDIWRRGGQDLHILSKLNHVMIVGHLCWTRKPCWMSNS